MTARKITLRLGALVIVGLALGGPTPGYVGTCDPGGSAGTVDRVQFCTDKETYQCARDLAAGRIDMTQYNVCAGHIDTDCHGFNFPAGCAPSHPLADACISALSDSSRISTRSEMIVECQSNTLCGAAPLTSGGI